MLARLCTVGGTDRALSTLLNCIIVVYVCKSVYEQLLAARAWLELQLLLKVNCSDRHGPRHQLRAHTRIVNLCSLNE
jgi:hypothetical protein